MRRLAYGLFAATGFVGAIVFAIMLRHHLMDNSWRGWIYLSMWGLLIEATLASAGIFLNQ